MNRKKALDSVVALVALLAVTAFLLIGFLSDGWPYAWLVFLTIPVTAVIIDIIQKKNVTGLLPGLVALLATIAYLILGFGYQLWHPGWLVFMAIPISAVIAGMFGHEADKPADGGRPDDSQGGQGQ
jgi:hypothetical protein